MLKLFVTAKLKEFITKLDRISKPNIFFLLSLITFIVLLWRNPFSTRTLIPNLEPYPDTFHYLVPPLNLLEDGRFVIARQGLEGIIPSVPPLYSIVLFPFLALNQDPRMFYFANILLSIFSLVVFYKILTKLNFNKWIVGLTIFLFSTNFFLYWYPQWAMAENLILPLFLSAVYLVISDVNYRNIILSALVPVSFFATKYAYLPVTLVYGIVYLTKVLFKNTKKKQYYSKNAIRFIILTLIFAIPAFVYANFTIKLNPLDSLLTLIKGVFPGFFYSEMSPGSGESAWFSLEYFQINFPIYLDSFIGGNVRFLWDFTPVLPIYVSMPGLIGLIIGFTKKKYRLLSVALTIMLLSQLIFISSFYAVDLRYLYHQIPSLLLGFGLFLHFLYEYTKDKKRKYVFYLLIGILSVIYLFSNLQRLRYQAVLNLRYAETPWYYLSVLELNKFFDQIEESDKKPVVISPMIPFYIDFYSNGKYDLLPLSPHQEFRRNREKIWGPGDYSDLHVLYEKYLINGRELYVSTYGLGNESYLHESFNELKQSFKLTEVKSACHDMCKIYKIEENDK